MFKVLVTDRQTGRWTETQTMDLLCFHGGWRQKFISTHKVHEAPWKSNFTCKTSSKPQFSAKERKPTPYLFYNVMQHHQRGTCTDIKK